MKWLKALFNFCKNVCISAYKAVGAFVRDAVRNAPATVVLCSAAIGAAGIISRLPFEYAVPLWIEYNMVAPTLGVGFVILMIYLIPAWNRITENIPCLAQ